MSDESQSTGDRRIHDIPVLVERRRGKPSQTPKLRCPHCGDYRSRVLETDLTGIAESPMIRRRRQCEACHVAFLTLETVIP